MSLTLENNGTAPIARVVNKKGDYYFVFLDDNEAKEQPKTTKKDLTSSKLSKQKIQQISAALSQGLTLSDLMETLSMEDNKEDNMSEFKVGPGEKIEPMPSLGSERVYAAGPSGSGKTYVIGQLARNYQILFPKNNVFAFVRQANDPALAGLEMEEIVIDNEEQEKLGKSVDDLITQIKELPISKFKNSLIIVDDLDNLPKELSKVIHAKVNDWLCNGRKHNISVYYCGHIMLRGYDTKCILNETQKVFFFLGTGVRGVKRFLQEYGGLENKEIAKVCALKGTRWIMIYRNVPRYIMAENCIYML